MKAIQTNNLTKYYGNTLRASPDTLWGTRAMRQQSRKSRGITNVSLTVDEGDFFGFIGPNGAGKSTTIRTLLGLITATKGSAEIFGQNTQTAKTAILETIGYLPSETMFYHGMRIKDILRLSANLRKKNCQAEAKQLCDRLELDTSRKIEELSLGNRKKVGIVCAMQHKPRLYILDEPTSGLDPLMQREFYSLLKERNKEGATIFLSSHILSEVQRYCKHAAVIREGEILVTDSVEHLSHTSAKRVVLRGIHNAPALANIKDIKTTQDSISFLYNGTPDLLLKTLAPLPITDITIAEPDLEEIFLHYYHKEAGTHDDF